MIKLKELLNEIEEACWDTHKQIGMKEKGGRMVPNCVKKEELDEVDEYDVVSEQDIEEFVQFMREYKQPLCEAEYRGRKVRLGKRMQGDVKKFKVYVKNPKGKVVKVNFGFGGSSAKGKRMPIKKNNPACMIYIYNKINLWNLQMLPRSFRLLIKKFYMH